MINAKELNVGRDYQFKNLNEALNISDNGDTVILHGGKYEGNFFIEKSISLIGKDNPVVDGKNNGTVITVEAPNVTIEGLTIQNTGKLLDKEDSGILVKANNVLIKNNHFKEALFGVYFRQADGGIVRDNFIEGKKELDVPRRGDLFRAWYSKNLLLERNKFQFGRDVIIWFAEGAVIRNNKMTNARYGLHFMYSSHSRVQNNILTGNSVGMYLMYSKDLKIENNLLAYNRGATGFGIGLKDLDNVELNGNVIADNRVGIFIDNSPREFSASMTYNKNVIAYNETGVDVISSLERSHFTSNSFIENYEQTSLTRSQNSDNDFWKGNYWSDYSGYDKDKNGVGDIPYHSTEILESLIEDKPNLRFFLYSPAVNTINYASEAFPIFKPESKLIDKAPSLSPIMPSKVPVIKIYKSEGFIILSIILSLLAAALILIFIFKNRIVHLRLN